MRKIVKKMCNTTAKQKLTMTPTIALVTTLTLGRLRFHSQCFRFIKDFRLAEKD